jgi:hypothetical protein
MSIISQFLDHQDLSQLNEQQVNTLNDHLDGVMLKELFTNEGLRNTIKQQLQPVVKGLLKKGG